MKPYKLIIPIICGFCIWGSTLAFASSIMAVGQDEGYSGKVMDKIIGKWAPPPQLKRTYKLKLRISLDGRGRLVECRTQRSSGLKALDVSACAAVEQAAPFGDAPYGMPTDIYLSFWTGDTHSRIPAEPDITEQGLADESTAAESRASAMNMSAKAKAEQAAKASGKHLPQSAPEKGAATPKIEKAAAAPVATAMAPAGKGEEGATPLAQKDKKEAGAPANAQAKPQAPAQGDTPQLAQHKYGEKYEKYLNNVVRKLRNAMYIPVQTAPGTYYATAQINFNKAGVITGSSIIKGSGDNLLDRYVLQGIKRAKQIPAPPPELGDTLDLTFTLVRQ